jgi:hypothetical protein
MPFTCKKRELGIIDLSQHVTASSSNVPQDKASFESKNCFKDCRTVEGINERVSSKNYRTSPRLLRGEL